MEDYSKAVAMDLDAWQPTTGEAPLDLDAWRPAIGRLPLDVAMIQAGVAKFFHLSTGELQSRRRTQRLAFCRQVAMYLARKLTDASFPEIGMEFGRDHSTVIHANNLIARRVAADAGFRQAMDRVEVAVRKAG